MTQPRPAALARAPRLVLLAALAVLAAVAAGTLGAAPAQATPQPTYAQAQRTVADLGRRMEQATERYNAARDALADSRAKQRALTASAARTAAEVETGRARASVMASAAYRGGRMSMLTSVLDSGSPQTFLDQMSTLTLLNAADQRELTALVAAQRTQRTTAAALTREVRSATASIRALAAQRTSIQRDLGTWRSLRDRFMARSSRSVSADGRTQTVATTSRPQLYAGPASGAAGAAVSFAYAQLGKPYQWGATGPSSFDCSGLTRAAWAVAGVSMPHSAGGQYRGFRKVSMSGLLPGDLLFYPGHIAIYVGGGQVIHAPTTGDVVKKVPMDRAGHFTGAVRPS